MQKHSSTSASIPRTEITPSLFSKIVMPRVQTLAKRTFPTLKATRQGRLAARLHGVRTARVSFGMPRIVLCHTSKMVIKPGRLAP